MSSKKLLFNTISGSQTETETVSMVIRPTSASGSNWQNTSNAYDNSTSTAATVSITKSNYTSRYLTVDFSSTNIPANAQITSAILTVIAKQSSSTSTRRITVYADADGSESNRVINKQLSDTNSTTLTGDISNYVKNMSNIKITGAITGSSTSSQTFYIYEIYMNVTYTIEAGQPEEPDTPTEPDTPDEPESDWVVVNAQNGYWISTDEYSPSSDRYYNYYLTTDLISVKNIDEIYLKINMNRIEDDDYKYGIAFIDYFDDNKSWVNNEKTSDIFLTNNDPITLEITGGAYIALEIYLMRLTDNTITYIRPEYITVTYKTVFN